MRSRRHFSPVVDCLQARVAPSAVAPVGTDMPGSLSIVSTMDDTGSPATDPSGYGSYPIILTPAPGTGISTGSVC
jgi:hypothetical protein